jgi:Fur family transcriptional regulator, ferric uptake regulator
VSEPHPVEALRANNVAAAVNALRARGLRVSAARRLVLEALFGAGGPLTAEEIADGRDVGSVYRNLDVLEQVGLVKHVHLGHGPGLYAPADREYALCERCGAVRTFEDDELDGVREAIELASGFTARFSHFPLIGMCTDCQSFLRATRNEF